MTKFRKGDILAVTAHDHNGNATGDNRVVFIGLYLGRVVHDHRRFLQLTTVFYPEGRGFVGVGRVVNVIEKETISIRNMGRLKT
jgi:hypothetical protein